MKNVKFEINAKSEGSSKTVISARNFKMAVAEPPAAGGDDLGANPSEYMFAAIEERCPVRDNLMNETPISVKVKNKGDTQ